MDRKIIEHAEIATAEQLDQAHEIPNKISKQGDEIQHMIPDPKLKSD
jgi:hypothetical protein